MLALGDVHEEALDVQRGPFVVLDDDGLIADGDRPPVASDEPVLERPARLAGREDPFVVGEDALAVVGMEELEEELGIAEPFIRCVAEEPLDLRADVYRWGDSGLVDVSDERKLLHELAVSPFGLLLGLGGGHVVVNHEVAGRLGVDCDVDREELDVEERPVLADPPRHGVEASRPTSSA